MAAMNRYSASNFENVKRETWRVKREAWRVKREEWSVKRVKVLSSENLKT